MIRNDWVLGIFGRDSQQDLLMVWIWNMRENSKITQGFSLSNLVNGGATSCSGQRGRLSLKKKNQMYRVWGCEVCDDWERRLEESRVQSKS